MVKLRQFKYAVRIGLVLTLASFPFISGCTVMASQGQLQALEEAKKAAESAEADLNACRQHKTELDRQLEDQKKKLAEWNNTRNTVQQALGQ